MSGDGVFWRGRQWQVTEHGLETVKHGVYDIRREDLGDLCGYGGAGPARELFWPHHVLAKAWVDVDEFAEAFARAVVDHGRWADMPPFWQIQLGRIAERAALRREAEQHAEPLVIGDLKMHPVARFPRPLRSPDSGV